MTCFVTNLFEMEELKLIQSDDISVKFVILLSFLEKITINNLKFLISYCHILSGMVSISFTVNHSFIVALQVKK